MMMEGKGLKIIGLGVDVPAEEFVKAAIENDACYRMFGSSHNHHGRNENVVDKVTEAGIRDKVTIMAVHPLMKTTANRRRHI